MSGCHPTTTAHVCALCIAKARASRRMLSPPNAPPQAHHCHRATTRPSVAIGHATNILIASACCEFVTRRSPLSARHTASARAQHRHSKQIHPPTSLARGTREVRGHTCASTSATHRARFNASLMPSSGTHSFCRMPKRSHIIFSLPRWQKQNDLATAQHSHGLSARVGGEAKEEQSGGVSKHRKTRTVRSLPGPALLHPTRSAPARACAPWCQR